MSTKGFTVVEWLALTAFIVIVVVIAVPRVKGMQVEARASKTEAELKVLQAAVESYYHHRTPKVYPGASTAICAETLTKTYPVVVGGVFYDPFRLSAEYSYIRSPNGKYYVLFSYGPDGAAGITGINDAGVLQGIQDDIYVTNGPGI